MNRVNRAEAHPLTYTGPSAAFFEGGLMGNGAMGVVACARPDAVVFYLGHNAVWDQRISEEHKPDILPFQTVFDRVKAIGETCRDSLEEDDWYRWYAHRMEDAYLRHLYPRPFPCGSVYFFFDKRRYEVVGYRVDITCGVIRIHLRGQAGADVFVTAFADMEQDTLHIRCADGAGRACQPFTAVRLIPHRDGGDPGFPAPEWRTGLCYAQRLPAREDMAPDEADRALAVTVRVACLPDPPVTQARIPLPADGGLEATVTLRHGPAADCAGQGQLPPAYEAALTRTAAAWEAYWARSGVALAREELEEIWYHNQYFLRLVLREGGVCPGLFGNFLYGRYGTDWHGDYHMNYNTQQVFWSCFITNHVELHEPYVRLVENLLPLSQTWAAEQYGLPGAYFPHSAYPVPMTTFPYPTPVWGWELCETPWTVQSLWWHYQYTRDTALLRERLFRPIQQAVQFLCAYMRRPDADFGDGRFHVFPTVVPELYGLCPRFTHNKDCTVDLALIRFVLRAYLEAVEVLDIAAEEGETAAMAAEILARFPGYPVSPGAQGVLLNVDVSDPDEVQNIPGTLVPVFPGEDPRMEEGEGRALAIRSWRRVLTEGGNELVFYALQGARLGVLDLESFARHVRYNRHPNGTLSDRATCAGGRYEDERDFDFMRCMGVWVENFSVPAVISNCLIHGHGDRVRLFPNWDLREPAAFSGHRVGGAFLVDAACAGGRVTSVSVTAERGGDWVWENPWTGQTERLRLAPGEQRTWTDAGA